MAIGGHGDIRSKESHISAPYDRICDFGVESGDSNEHHCAAERGEDVGRDYCKEVPRLNAVGWKDHDGHLRKAGCYEAPNKGPTPDVNWRVGGGPAAGVVA